MDFLSSVGATSRYCANMSLLRSWNNRGITSYKYSAPNGAIFMPSITVIGAGFSGLVTAYFLVKRGCKVRILERSNRAGGLIETIQSEHGIVEKAANGILCSAKLEAIASDVGVPLLTTRREGGKGFIYRGKPRQLPLNVFDLLKTGARLATHATSLS